RRYRSCLSELPAAILNRGNHYTVQVFGCFVFFLIYGKLNPLIFLPGGRQVGSLASRQKNMGLE
ncbi:MAG: hypothetical protein VYB38_12615, partial [Bacteroidota bacterium]|nr:hypothetical protein [Bacteroidota bacterium]